MTRSVKAFLARTKETERRRQSQVANDFHVNFSPVLEITLTDLRLYGIGMRGP